MKQTQYETTMAKLLALGVPLVSLALITGSVTDPVNVPKFLMLGGLGVGSLSLFLLRGFYVAAKVSNPTVIAAISFLAFSTLSLVLSKLPLAQNLYGVYGRNTGFLTYLFLVAILLGALTLNKSESFTWLYRALFITGAINVIYCGWVVFFGDFIGWNNPYGNILGLFGNPNFIGAFLGIWISATSGYLLGKPMKIWSRVGISFLLILALYEVYKSHAVQGVVVTAAGLATVGFFYIRSKTSTWVPVGVYSFGIVSFGLTALLGALQKGPLAQYVYKTSVSLRGSYWNAGLETGLNHPWTGVGMDGYGDWYRRSRSVHAATVMPGPDTVSNSAHNVVIDIFSYGGFPLLFSYLALLLLGALSIIKGLRRTKTYDPIFVALSVAWIGYQLQSIISINQIGLAVWGWVLTGALIAYEGYKSKGFDKNHVDSGSQGTRAKGRNSKNEVITSPLIAGLGVVLGLIVACPPISADMAWYKSTNSGNFVEVKKALTPSYLHPRSSERLVNVIGILENSQLFEQAHEYAQIAVRYNPDNFDSWLALYSVKNSTTEEKALSLENLKRLDPNNPDVTKR
jgi:O-antigen ligase